MNCKIQEAGSDWLSTNERVALHHSVLVAQFQSSEVSRGAKLAQVLVLITQPFSSFPRRSLCRMNHHHVADHPLHEAWADAGRGPEPARASGQRGPEAVRSVDPARGLEPTARRFAATARCCPEGPQPRPTVPPSGRRLGS